MISASCLPPRSPPGFYFMALNYPEHSGPKSNHIALPHMARPGAPSPIGTWQEESIGTVSTRARTESTRRLLLPKSASSAVGWRLANRASAAPHFRQCFGSCSAQMSNCFFGEDRPRVPELIKAHIECSQGLSQSCKLRLERRVFSDFPNGIAKLANFVRQISKICQNVLRWQVDFRQYRFGHSPGKVINAHHCDECKYSSNDHQDCCRVN